MWFGLLLLLRDVTWGVGVFCNVDIVLTLGAMLREHSSNNQNHR